MKKIVFLTGTRADFGKIKSLIKITQDSVHFDVHIFVTGMHMHTKYGFTVDEIFKSGFKNIHTYINHDGTGHMDRALAKTIGGFSRYIEEIKPDLIIVHGDRVEALAGAIVGSLNNILVAHIEGGELSGTIDEIIRHSVSKMSHIHLVANELAQNRLVQLGELRESIFILGSPDLDLMNPDRLPDITTVKDYYGIPFGTYSLAMFHPVTTEYEHISVYANYFVESLLESNLNYILVYPNNDLGSDEILSMYKRLENNPKFKIYPSLRFEYFLTLLSKADFIIGNSSAGIREAPYYNVRTIDIGTRQSNRAHFESVFHSGYDQPDILDTIQRVVTAPVGRPLGDTYFFGNGDSDTQFLSLLNGNKLWTINHQKHFQDL